MRRPLIVLAVTLGIHVLALTIWYGPATGHPGLLTTLPYAGSLAGGFIVGLFLKSRFLLNAMLLSLAQALVSGGAHLVAVRLGLPVDMRNIDAMILVIPLIPIFAFFTVLGCCAGALLLWLSSINQ